jgi:hypothetical protein
MYIIRDINEFKQAIQQPNPSQIYAFIPNDFEVLSEKPIQILNNEPNALVYGDVEILRGQLKIVKVNPSFDVSVIRRGFALDSPIFLRTSKPLFAQSTELNYLILELLQQVIGIHVPEPIFRWKQNFYTGPAKETSIV